MLITRNSFRRETQGIREYIGTLCVGIAWKKWPPKHLNCKLCAEMTEISAKIIDLSLNTYITFDTSVFYH